MKINLVSLNNLSSSLQDLIFFAKYCYANAGSDRFISCYRFYFLCFSPHSTVGVIKMTHQVRVHPVINGGLILDLVGSSSFS